MLVFAWQTDRVYNIYIQHWSDLFKTLFFNYGQYRIRK